MMRAKRRAKGRARSAGEVIRDEKTFSYFDHHTPEYGTERLENVALAIERYRGAASSLIDIGCGSGNSLEFLTRETGIGSIAGMDISPQYLEQTAERLGCKTYEASILDREQIEGIETKFDFVLLAAVLHHLIGRSRRQSRNHASLAVANAMQLVAAGGYLIVLEPIYNARFAMDVMFWVKKLVSSITTERIQVFSEDSNIGPPVVSFFSNEELFKLIESGGHNRIVDRWVVPNDALPRFWTRLLRPNNTTVVAQPVGR